MNLNQEITKLLNEKGCSIIGFADLRTLPKEPRRGGDYGIIMGEPYTAEGMKENLEGRPQLFERDSGATLEPLELYKKTAENFLYEKDYKTYKYLSNTITHKTIGTLAGLGWIGRCALLTTNNLGPALRLTALLTNAPIECGTPITKSQCPTDCTECMIICPVNAIKGGLWEQVIHRDEFFDVKTCMKGRQSRKPMCGLCISVCPYTKKGLGY